HLLVVVAFATDVGVGRQGRCRRLVSFQLVQLVFENVVHPLVTVDASRQGALAGSFQTVVPIALGQAQDAQTGAVRLLRMTAPVQDEADESGCLRATLLRPGEKAFWRPAVHGLMGWRHVLASGRITAGSIHAGVRSLPLATIEDFH